MSGEAFKRVDAEIWSNEIIAGLEDNSCEIFTIHSTHPITRRNAKYFGALVFISLFACICVSDEKQFGEDGYGFKASAILSQVRGKDFRHEKTKKKRGNYRGGAITLGSNSFKYSE